MSEDCSGPQNYPAWRTRDAMRWAACRPEPWARRRWSGPALIVVAAAFTGSVAGYAAAAAAALYLWAAARHRRAARHRQRLLAANAAGTGTGLRVLIRQDNDAGARTWVYAADDTAGRRPLFSCATRWTPAPEKGADPGPSDPDDDDADDEPRTDTPLREAVLLGALCEGARVVLVPAGHQACAAGPVRPVPWQAGPELHP